MASQSSTTPDLLAGEELCIDLAGVGVCL